MAERDEAERTEEPTQKRRDDARKKGDAPKSQEIVAAVMTAAALLGFALLAGPAAKSVGRAGAAFLDHPHEFAVDGGSLQRLFAAIAAELGLALGGLAALFVVAAVLANAAQALPVFNPARLAPNLGKLSPIEGVKRIYGPAALFNFLKGLLKIAIVGAILVYALWPDRALLAGLVGSGEDALLEASAAALMKLLGLTVGAMAAIAGVDYAFQRRAWLKRLRMTKEEVKRELREQEGDPVIRGRLKSQREARARRRMLVAVKDATVLIMNPTHFAVALKYEAGVDPAPRCVAKGADDIALRMRQVANDNRVPVVENPALARALHATAELDAEIPVAHYEAVAAVIGFVIGKSRSGPAGSRSR